MVWTVAGDERERGTMGNARRYTTEIYYNGEDGVNN